MDDHELAHTEADGLDLLFFDDRPVVKHRHMWRERTCLNTDAARVHRRRQCPMKQPDAVVRRRGQYARQLSWLAAATRKREQSIEVQVKRRKMHPARGVPDGVRPGSGNACVVSEVQQAQMQSMHFDEPAPQALRMPDLARKTMNFLRG